MDTVVVVAHVGILAQIAVGDLERSAAPVMAASMASVQYVRTNDSSGSESSVVMSVDIVRMSPACPDADPVRGLLLDHNTDPTGESPHRSRTVSRTRE